MKLSKALNNGWSKTFAFLQTPVPLPSLGRRKKRRHTHYHYSHKRATVAKPAVSREPHHAVHMYAETPEKEESEAIFDEPETDIAAKAPTPRPAGTILMPEEVRKEPKGPGAWSLLKSRLSRPIVLPTFFVKKTKPAQVFASVSPSEPVAVPVAQTQDTPVGKIIDPVKQSAPTKAEVARAVAQIEHEDGWMQKVKARKTDHTLGKWSGWNLLKERLFQPVELPSFLKAKKEVPIEKPLTKEDLANDSFLKRVQTKSIDAPVGTQGDVPTPVRTQEAVEQKTEPVSTLASFATEPPPAPAVPEQTQAVASSQSRILPPLEKKKDEPSPVRKEQPAVAVDIKKEEPSPTKAAESKPVPKIVVQKRSSALSNYIASLNYMGLGKERMMFIQNMATMLNAGLPLIDALRTIQLETHNKAMKKLLQQILASVENGSSFWRAMDDRHFFSLHAIALVRIGEESGSLAENMQYLAQQEEKDHELKGKVKMAMIYPSIVMTIMFILVIGLGWFVLPNLIGVLFSLNVPLPLVTRMVIAFTNFFTNYGTIAVPGMLVAMAAFVVLNKVCTPVKIATQWAMFRIPGVGVLAREATIARFGVILGGLLKAGVPVIESVQSLIEVTPVIAYRNLYTRMLEHITVGDSFSKSFQSIKGSEKLLPPSVQQLVVTGEKSGSLADIMLKVADIYDKKASETAQKLPVVLEPMILMFIGGLVGTIAFAIIVPIYGIVGSVGR